MTQEKQRIGVLCGGPSSEREISLRSGRAIHEALSSEGFSVVFLDLSEDPKKIPDQIKNAEIEMAFIALHGAFGEDGQIQALCEELKIPYTGSPPSASKLAMDKVASRSTWAQAGLPIPRWVWAHEICSTGAGLRVEEFQFPLVVKPVGQGSSIGMSIVDRAEELPAAIALAGEHGDKVILEEYLEGPELTVGILEDQPLPVIQIVPKRRFYDYAAKYTPGMTEYLVPAPILPSESIRAHILAQQAHRLLGCRSFSRVDFILEKKRGPVLLEINTIPGMTNASLLPKAAQAVGINFAQLCRRMLASAEQMCSAHKM